MQAVIAAVLTGLLLAIGMRYFRGNVLGFVGLCFLLVLLVYLIAGACARYHRRRTQRIPPR